MMKTTEAKPQAESSHSWSSKLKGETFFPFNQAKTTSFFGPATIQPKLKIGEPDDQYEKQADRVADAVVQKKDSDIQRQPMEEEEELQMKREPILQRKCKECEEGEHIQKKANDSSGSEMTAGNQLSQQLQMSRGSGNRLPGEVGSEMSRKIGADFKNVNIHTGSTAVQMSKSIGARAFTYGNDIYFNSGEYNPSTNNGKHLLAHELTHVVQQNSGIQTKRIQRTVSRLVGCDPGPFTSSGGTNIQDPADFITQAEESAAELIQQTVDELNYTRNKIIGGEPAAWPVIGDQLAFALTLMGLNPDDRDVWTDTGIGTVHLLMRRLRAIRGTLTGTGIFYHCDPQGNVDMSPCSPGSCSGGGGDAFSCAGSFRIGLCDSFWSQALLQERAVILMHEHAHNFAEFIQDSGREGNAECYARFVIEANGLTSSNQSITLCPNP